MSLAARTALLAAAITAAAPAAASGAEAIHGLTADNQLVTFHSDSPGALRSAVPVTGLAEGERLLALDGRPATGQLYALGASSRVYRVHPISGAATATGAPFTPLLAGQSFGFDFNPVVDRIRVVSDGRQNIRLNPDDGQVAGDDQPLAYATTDSGAGTTPAAGAAAYTPVANGESALFVLDTARDVLALQSPPNSGTLTTVGPLHMDVREPVGFDIGADGRAWVLGRTAASGPQLWSVDLTTGALAAGARRPAVGGDVIAIAAAGPVPDDTQRPSVLISLADTRPTLRSLRRTLKVGVSCSEACALSATLKAGSRTLGTATGGITRAGRLTLRLTPNSAARRLVRAGRSVRATLSVSARDAASNHARSSRRVRFG